MIYFVAIVSGIIFGIGLHIIIDKDKKDENTNFDWWLQNYYKRKGGKDE